jgi:hypothetical protein
MLWLDHTKKLRDGCTRLPNLSSENDIEQMQDVRVTCPLCTVLDVLQTGHVDRNLIRQAIDEAMRRGLITGKQIDSLPHDRLRDSFREFVGQHL